MARKNTTAETAVTTNKHAAREKENVTGRETAPSDDIVQAHEHIRAQETVSSEDAAVKDSDTEKNGCLHTIRDEKEKKALMRRLSIIEGQIRGIRGMVDNDVYCINILTQVAAANSALNCFAREILAQHLKNCVREDVEEGHDEKLNEVIKVLPRLMK